MISKENEDMYKMQIESFSGNINLQLLKFRLQGLFYIQIPTSILTLKKLRKS